MTYNNRGLAYTATKDFDRAIADFGEAIQLDPKYSVALNNRGIAYYAKRDYDHAIADYDQAIKRNPDYPVAFINRGDAWRAKGSTDRAEAYGQAARLDPDNVLAYIHRADVYEAQKRYDLAITDYDQVIRLAPANAAGWSGLRWSRAIVGQLDQALADCNEALRLESLANALEARALVYLKLGQSDKAIADYDAALKTDPTLAGPLYGRGMAKILKGEVAGANAATAAAKEISPKINDSFAAYNLRTVRGETALPAVEAPVAANPEPVAPTTEAVSNRAPPAELAAPPPAAESTTSPLTAIEAPVATRTSSPEPPIVPPAEAPGNRAAQSEPAALPADEMTTSVTRAPQSGPVKSTSLVTFPASPATVVAPPPADDCSSAETHWKSVESIGTLAAYNDHLARFSKCVFSTLAAERIEALKK